MIVEFPVLLALKSRNASFWGEHYTSDSKCQNFAKRLALLKRPLSCHKTLANLEKRSLKICSSSLKVSVLLLGFAHVETSVFQDSARRLWIQTKFKSNRLKRRFIIEIESGGQFTECHSMAKFGRKKRFDWISMISILSRKLSGRIGSALFTPANLVKASEMSSLKSIKTGREAVGTFNGLVMSNGHPARKTCIVESFNISNLQVEGSIFIAEGNLEVATKCWPCDHSSHCLHASLHLWRRLLNFG